MLWEKEQAAPTRKRPKVDNCFPPTARNRSIPLPEMGQQAKKDGATVGRESHVFMSIHSLVLQSSNVEEMY